MKTTDEILLKLIKRLQDSTNSDLSDIIHDLEFKMKYENMDED